MVGLKQGSTLKSGKYKIVKTLGQGSFGITYLATTRISMDGQLGKMDVNVNVTIKEFFMSDLNSRAIDGTSVERTNSTLVKNYLNKFQREAENLSKLHHPNIVKVLEVFDENNTAYYVMEFIDGETIDDYIKRNGNLSTDESLKITKEVCSALSYMHGHKMLHLDLKPKNIMRDSEGHIYLIDFGLAKQYNDNGEPESSTTLGLGTPGYAPIEQAHYKQDGTFPVTLDIYAMGASLYKMLTGKTPPESSYVLNDGLPLDALKQVGVDDNVIAIVEKAMAPIKKDRYQTVAALLEDISTLSSSDDERTDIKNVDEGTIIDQEVVNKKKVAIYPDTNKIDFYFNGSSVPPPYHRSYETHITEHSISLKITCYDDELYDGKFPFNKSRYDNLLNVIRNLNIKSIPEESSGATGGETLTLALHKGDEEYFSCYIYGSEYQIFEGTTDANLYIIKEEIEKCIPNFEALISKQKDEESEESDYKDKSFFEKYWKYGMAAIVVIFCIFLCYYWNNSSSASKIPKAQSTQVEESQRLNGDGPETKVYPTFTEMAKVQIGDYVYSDGSFSHDGPTGNKTCVGIVFSLKTTATEKRNGWTHGQMVALKDAGNCAWSDNEVDFPSPHKNVVTQLWTDKMISEIRSDKDGYVYSTSKHTKNCPAFEAAKNYNVSIPFASSGWYMPSIGQWCDILENICGFQLKRHPEDYIEVMLVGKNKSYLKFDTSAYEYWSSSDRSKYYVWVYQPSSFESGGLTNGRKGMGGKVRAVAAF